MLRDEGDVFHTWSAVHHRWKEAVNSKYYFHDDAMESMVQYPRKGTNMSLLFIQTEPHAVLATTEIEKHVLSQFRCVELFIDSTYKTNRSKL